jgi:hypothetical protein
VCILPTIHYLTSWLYIVTLVKPRSVEWIKLQGETLEWVPFRGYSSGLQKKRKKKGVMVWTCISMTARNLYGILRLLKHNCTLTKLVRDSIIEFTRNNTEVRYGVVTVSHKCEQPMKFKQCQGTCRIGMETLLARPRLWRALTSRSWSGFRGELSGIISSVCRTRCSAN